MVSAHKVVGDMAEAGLLRMIGTIAVILPAVALVQVLANAHDYRQPAVVIAVWLAVLGAAAWLAPRMRARVLSAAETAAAIAIAIAAVTVVGAERSGHVMPGSVDLAILGTLWLTVVVALSAPDLGLGFGRADRLRRAQRAADPGRGAEPVDAVRT